SAVGGPVRRGISADCELTSLDRAPIVRRRSRGRGNALLQYAARAARDVGRSTGLGCKLRMGAETVAIIPARFRSTRLPGKALAMSADRPIISHVAEPTRAARGPADVLVATDDTRIRDAVVERGGRVVMTRADHPSGTDRLAEVAAGLTADVLVNVQGDLPLLDPAMVELLAARMAADPGLAMATLASPIRAAQ